ncbi:kelch repeat-containing protein [uncultured Maribacter sp.]|uniref:kelch repeat-containing protein n=1 Tax=uncultured Maribacter sp. TaxID=431308 RepID=UPI0030EC29BF|tara:strand:+ start:20205 stop:21254 length:1050 start_codon:yes stop_codon:yes gene_type:complete
MKAIKIITTISIALIILSCQKEELYLEPSSNQLDSQSLSGRTLFESNVNLNFNLETTSSEMGGFAGQSMTLFKDQLWLVGGDNSHTPPWNSNSKVWKSNNGINWKLVTSNLFEERRNHSLLVFKNKMWLIGGINNTGEILSDIWNTTDGIHWTRVRSLSPLTEIGQNNSIVFKKRLYVFLGNGRQNEEIWSSSDGINWRIETDNAFPVRSHYKTIVFDGYIYVIGGWIRGAELTNEVWASADGSHWHQNRPATTIFENRINHTATIFDGKVWVIGGESWDKSGARTFYGDIWYSSNMKYWFKYDKKQPLYKGLQSHSSLNYNNKLWIFGGYRPDSSMASIITDNIWSVE